LPGLPPVANNQTFPNGGGALGHPPSFRLVTLRQRSDFLAAATGRRAHGPGFTCQHRKPDGEMPLRFGFTVTKKTGNAPERNRIRRRLREAVRRAGEGLEGIGGDFVLIGRREALGVPFETLVKGLSEAIRRLAQGGGQPPRPNRAS
jgi:ribonuclease P protein component